MRVAINNHQGKANGLQKALEDAGHTIGKDYCDVLLIDFDGPVSHYEYTIERHVIQGAKVFLYSHGAMPIVAWDGIYEPSERVSAYLAQSPGQKAVMEAYGYPHPIHVIGWHYCKILPWKPAKEVKRVVFAPWHPHANGFGWLDPKRRELNGQIFEDLLKLDGIELTARCIGTPHKNGLREVDGVNYVKAYPDGSTLEIDWADLVIAEGTYAYLAIARGKPTVMFGQDMHPQDGDTPEMVRYVENWDLYRDLMRYPFDFGDGRLSKTLLGASRTEPVEWKGTFIGETFEPVRFVTLLESLLVEEVEYA
jgi:hypothetical protein